MGRVASAESSWFALAAFAGIAFTVIGIKPARAQPSDDRSKAATLFEEGHRLMADGRFTDACPKLARSNTLDPEIGTKMNLARCYELVGQTASAWSTWKAAAEAAGTQKLIERDDAERKKQADREAFARSRLRTLEPHLLHVALKVVSGERAPASISLDGGVIPPEEWGAELPVDPGIHGVEARAPERLPWSTQFEVAAIQSSCVVIVVPLLEVDPVAFRTSLDPPSDTRRWMRPTAVAVASVSGVLGLVGAGFGWGAIRAHERAANDCVSPGTCTAQRNRDLQDLNDDAAASDVAFAAAAGGLVVAGVLWWTAPTSGTRVALQPVAGRRFNGLGLSGRF